MKLTRIALGVLATLLVVGVIVVVSSETGLFATTHTERFTGTTTPVMTLTSVVNNTTTVTINENVQINGTCTAVSYIIPDTEEVSLTTVTMTSGTNTTYFVNTVTISHAGETTLGTTTYSTSTYANNTGVYTMTSTSDNLNDIPSNGWTVTTCTFTP